MTLPHAPSHVNSARAIANVYSGARALLAAGHSPVRLIRNSKAPIEKAWTNYCDAPIALGDDPSTQNRWNGSGIGAACGYGSPTTGYLCVVDIDNTTPEQEKAIRAVLEKHTSISPVGKVGQHGYALFYRTRERMQRESGKRHFPRASDSLRMLDMLSYGHQTVLPPSIHPDTGKPYQWLDPNHTLYNTPLTELPWLPDNVLELMHAALMPWLSEAGKQAASRPPIGIEPRYFDWAQKPYSENYGEPITLEEIFAENGQLAAYVERNGKGLPYDRASQALNGLCAKMAHTYLRCDGVELSKAEIELARPDQAWDIARNICELVTAFLEEDGGRTAPDAFACFMREKSGGAPKVCFEVGNALTYIVHENPSTASFALAIAQLQKKVHREAAPADQPIHEKFDVIAFEELIRRTTTMSPGEAHEAMLQIAAIKGAWPIKVIEKHRNEMLKANRAAARLAKDAAAAFPHMDKDKFRPARDSLHNALMWLERNKVDIWFNEFTGEAMADTKPVNDHMLRTWRDRMHSEEFFASSTLVYDAILRRAHERRRHPVKEYFESIRGKWNPATPKLDFVFSDYVGTPDEPGWRWASRAFFMAIVMRTLHPGAKFDCVPSWISEEGRNKSLWWEACAIREEWFLPGFSLSWSQKETIENTAGILVAEYEEMAGHGQKDQNNIKANTTRRKDKSRLAYDKFATVVERAFVVGATANDARPLTSKTGNRRFLPCTLENPIDVDGFVTDRDEIFAEALDAAEAHFKAHGRDIPMPKEHWAYFGQAQEAHRHKDNIEETIEDAFDGIVEGHVRVSDVNKLAELNNRDRYGAASVEHAMKRMGWVKKQARMGKSARQQRYFLIGENPEKLEFKYDMDDENKVLGLKRIPRA